MWKIGDKAVRFQVMTTRTDPGYEDAKEPKMGQVVTVNYIYLDDPWWYLGFEEMPQDVEYNALDYRKLSEVSGEMSQEILNEVLTSVEEPVEV